MPIRETLGFLVARAAAAPVRELVEEALASRDLARPADLDALRAQLDRLATRASASGLSELHDRATALEERCAGLSTKVDMTVTALQSATRELAAARQALADAHTQADAAARDARDARELADSVAERLAETDAAGAALALPVTEAEPTPRAAPGSARQCKAPDCERRYRARGFCGMHYQRWRRGNLDGFVLQNGSVTLADGSTWQVGARYAGMPAARGEDDASIRVGETLIHR